jgi:hypothetical protein
MANSKITKLNVKGTTYDVQDKVTNYELSRDENDNIILTKTVDGETIDSDTISSLVWHEF